uniref:Uncharacterized protein n=1 Tax=Myoviridae sp. ctYA416 TaxID=2825125 RepID=A0A8S5UTW5_9CAUD|nr:MAG TPA: hypothetical protein [Myoviridae sp. ctYA416]
MCNTIVNQNDYTIYYITVIIYMQKYQALQTPTSN